VREMREEVPAEAPDHDPDARSAFSPRGGHALLTLTITHTERKMAITDQGARREANNLSIDALHATEQV